MKNLLFLTVCLLVNRCVGESSHDDNDVIDALRRDMQALTHVVTDLVEQFADMKSDIQIMKVELQDHSELLVASQRHHKSPPPPTQSYLTGSFGCNLAYVNLTCPYDKYINVSSASYGQYVTTCAEGTCCTPKPTDCLESLETNHPIDWAVLKEVCDGQVECEFINQGTSLQSCVDPYFSDFLHVYYVCEPEDPLDFVGFTAYADEPLYYNLGDVVAFQNVTSNIGNSFQLATSIFVCPISGVYFFSLTVANVNTNNVMTAHLMKETQSLASLHSKADGLNQSGAGSVVTCERGESVWVQCNGDARHMNGGETYKYSTFSGFLLHEM